MTAWRAELLVPAHRIVVAVRDGEVLEISGGSGPATFRGYRRMPDAVHGMIAWPNTVLLTGPANVVVDPGYQTQGDMLLQALGQRGLTPDDVGTVVMTHLHADHVTALPQLGRVSLHAHADELRTPHAHRNRGVMDDATVHALDGDAGEIAPGLRWIHTPGHSPGHIAVLVDTADGLVVVAGDTMGPDPAWFALRTPPEGLPDRDAHLAAYDRIASLSPRTIIPGHYPPIQMS